MSGIRQTLIKANGITINVAEQGTGPLILLCHGFPDCWYSWRKTIPALADAGFHAVAPDMRGYGKTSCPTTVEDFTIFHLVGDMLGIVEALGEKTSVIVGHDAGAEVAWAAAMMRPDVFTAVAGLSVPYLPRAPNPPSILPSTFYQNYFQAPGVAETEFEADIPLTLRKIFFGASGDNPHGYDELITVPPGEGFLSRVPVPANLPAWLTEADLKIYVDEFTRTGFRGGLNWYRNNDRNWALLAPFHGALVRPPSLYITGDLDLVFEIPQVKGIVDNLLKFIAPGLRQTLKLPGCGHWTQQERSAEVNAALLAFLRSL